MARNQQSRGQDLLRGALNLASSYVNKRTELPRAIIPPAVGIGAGVGDFVFDPTRPTIGESTQSGLGTGKAAAELMKYAKFPQLSAPTQAPVGEGTVLLGEGQSPYQPQAPQAQTPVANGQPSSIPLLPPVVTTEQTEMGPVTLEVPVVSPEGAAFMEGVTLPPAGSGTVLQTPQQAGAGTVMQQPLSEQFSQAGVQQGSFIPQQLGAQPAAPTSPQANFESRMATGIPLTDAEIQSATQFGASRGLSFSPETGYTQAPTPAGPTFQGQPLSEYLAGGIQLDPQGRMIPKGFETRAEAFSDYEQEAAGREQRLESMLADRAAAREAQRGGEDGGITDSQFRALSGGNQDVERQLRAQAELGMGPFKERDQGLTFEQKLAQDKFDFDVAKFKFDEASKAEDAATVERKSQDAAKFAARDMLRQNQNVMRKAQRAGKNIGFSTTGATGALLGLVPGTGAFDQKSTVETLQADAAFSTLQQMRNASKTGGALGQVSERELDLLMGAVGNLKIGQSEEQFRNNLVEYINLRNDAMGNIYDAFEADYGTQAANEAFKVNSRQDLVPEGGTSTGGSGTTTDAPSGRFLVEVASD